MGDNMTRYPTGFGQWLIAAGFALGPVKEVAILGKFESPQTQDLVDTLWKQYQPRLVTAISNEGKGTPKLLEDRFLIDNQPTAYICQGFVCHQPINTPKELAKQLR